MAFAIAGGVITISGTESNLAGISSMPGVISTTIGNKTHYSLASGNRIVISGNVTHDPDAEVLVFTEVSTGSSAILVTGTYNYGKEYTKNGTIRYSQGLGIINKKTLGATNGLNGNYLTSAVVRTSGANGIFIWKGGQIMSPTLLTNGGGTFDIYEGTFICDYNSINTTNPPSISVQTASSVSNFRGLKLYSPTNYPGILFQWEKSPNIFTDVVMTNGSGMGTSGATLNVSSGVALPIVIKNFTSIAGDNDLTFWRENYIKAINFFKGSDAITKGMSSSPISVNIGLVEIYKEVSFSLKNSNNVSVENAVIICKDYNNNNRQPNYRGYSWLADRIYQFTTGVLGTTATQEVLLLASVKTGNNAWDLGIQNDYRGKNGDTTDVFTFYANHYLYQQQPITNALKGIGTGVYPSTIFLDSNITMSESDAGVKLTNDFVVDAINHTISIINNTTLDELYDVIKYYRTRSIQSNLLYPSIDTYPITASGDTLITAMDITGFEFLTAGTKFKRIQANGVANGVVSNIEITGNVTQDTPTNLINVKINGTLIYNTNTNVNVTITDTYINTIENLGTGIVTINKVNSTIDDYVDAEINFIDSTISVIGADSVTIHPTARDRDLNENISETFTTSFNFKYGSVVNGTTMATKLYLRCVAGGIPFNLDKNISKGDNLHNLGIVAQLALLTAKIELTATTEQLRKVNNNVIDANLLLPVNQTF